MKTLNPKERDHAKFSPSAAERWLACPGSIGLSIGLESVESEAASEGTDAHTCVETILKNPTRKLAIEAQLRKEYGDEMVEYAATAAGEIAARAKGMKFLVEVEASLRFLHKDFWGHLDAAAVELFGTLVITDFKYGVWPVDPENNPQLIAYALAVAHKYDYNFERVLIVVNQPRAGHDENETVWETDVETLQEWATKFKRGIAAALKPNAKLEAGPHCKWCPAKLKCPEISSVALREAKIDFQPVLDHVETPKIELLDDDDVATILDHAERIEMYLGEVRAYAFRQLEKGCRIPGWKLVPKRAQRKWIDAEKAEKEAQKAFGEIAFDKSLKSPAQLEKLAADAKPWVARRVAAVSSGVTLAPESDRREGTSSRALDFQPVDDEKGNTMMAAPAKKKVAKKKATKKKTAKKH